MRCGLPRHDRIRTHDVGIALLVRALSRNNLQGTPSASTLFAAGGSRIRLAGAEPAACLQPEAAQRLRPAAAHRDMRSVGQLRAEVAARVWAEGADVV